MSQLLAWLVNSISAVNPIGPPSSTENDISRLLLEAPVAIGGAEDEQQPPGEHRGEEEHLQLEGRGSRSTSGHGRLNGKLLLVHLVEKATATRVTVAS